MGLALRSGNLGEATFMSANSLFKDANDPDRNAKHEWGIYPPEPQAKSSVVTPVSDQRPAATSGTDSAVRQCRYCTETLPPGARECPLCLREVTDSAAGTRKTNQPLTSGSRPLTATSLAASPAFTGTPLTGGGVPMTAANQPATAAAPAGAVYTLESPAQCPECNTEINSIHVIRVMRTQVSFTSTLPRKAYVIACPACRRLLSAGLSGLL
jgi:hypothetical protein